MRGQFIPSQYKLRLRYFLFQLLRHFRILLSIYFTIIAHNIQHLPGLLEPSHIGQLLGFEEQGNDAFRVAGVIWIEANFEES
jgi:hypothetical protein